MSNFNRNTNLNISSLTNLQEVDKALKKAKEFAENIIQTANVIFLQLDCSGNILKINKAALEITGYSLAEIEGKNLEILIPKDRFPDTWTELERLAKKEPPEIFESTILTKGGEERQILWKNSAIRDGNNITGTISFGINITQYRVTEEALRESEKRFQKLSEKADEMNRFKSNFLTNMSHELRTPLIGILGFAELMNELDREERDEACKIIYDSGKRLMNTLDMLLELSRIETERIELDLEIVDVNSICRNIVELFHSAAAEKNLDLTLESDEEKLSCLLDEKYLLLLIQNLVNNAIKYTDHGKVTITTKRLIPEGKIQILVLDTGIGISSEDQEIIFEPFRQVSEGLSRQYQGTGIGLMITRKLTELMKGKIRVISKPGVGSRFIIEFPDPGH